jgi:hypothetical protein
MKPGLKLYVWDDVLYDYTSGIMFAVASSKKEARAALLKKCDYIPEHDLRKKPKVYTGRIARAVWGGG